MGQDFHRCKKLNFIARKLIVAHFIFFKYLFLLQCLIDMLTFHKPDDCVIGFFFQDLWRSSMPLLSILFLREIHLTKMLLTFSSKNSSDTREGII